MTNPTNKYTKETYLKKFNQANKNLKVEAIIQNFTTVDDQITVKCKHGERKVLGWQALKMKHCCRTGYYESGKMWESHRKSLETWKIELENIYKDEYDFNCLEKVPGKEKLKFRCRVHGKVEQWNQSLRNGTGCFQCNQERLRPQRSQQAKKNFIESGAYLKGRANISKAETNWLNDIGVPQRQHLIEETGQTVDGFNKDTKTVYLYHGRYWHGCPETYNPEEIHPSIKVPMKELYQHTLDYEQKIKDAGYNLITKWG